MAEPLASVSSGPHSADSVSTSARHGSPSQCNNTTSLPPKAGWSKSVESWDAHKKAVSSASSPSSSSSGNLTISHVSSPPSARMCTRNAARRRPSYSTTARVTILAATISTRRRRYYGSRGPCTLDRASSSPHQNPPCFPCQQCSWSGCIATPLKHSRGPGCLFLQLAKPSCDPLAEILDSWALMKWF
jgi:hypothetical protein